jgi:hypothetical protein
MNGTAPAASQVRAQVAAIHKKKRAEERCIGIRVSGGWDGEETAEIEGQPYRFVWCDSALAVREALVEHESTPDVGLVVVTAVDEAELGSDVLARLARRRLHRIDPWGTVMSLFSAREAAPGLRGKRWMAEALLESAPADGYRAVPSGVLDEETVFSILLERRLGIDVARPVTRDLLAWCLQPESATRLATVGAEIRGALAAWIERAAGASGRLVLSCVEAGYGAEAVPIGLACNVLFDPARPAEVREAAVRLERYVGNVTVPQAGAVEWAAAAVELVERIAADSGEAAASRLLERSDLLLGDLRVDGFAHLSRFSPLGFEQRLDRFGKRLHSTLKGKLEEVPRELSELAESILAHRGARRWPERAAKVEMAMRLLRWLVRGADAAVGSFEEAALAYARDGGFVDWARHSISGGDGVGTLHKAYGRLGELCLERREAENKRFAELLVSWTEAGSTGDGVVRVEEVLARVVAPAAAAAAVLLVVVDGMSFAVFRELIADISSQGWIDLGPEGASWPVPVVAALPSVTEVSRASLFVGRLANGASDLEKKAFSAHADLLAVSKSGAPPVLFHKSTLSETGGFELAPDVRNAIASEKQRVVGVVVNAVDDHLLKGGQIEVPWTLKHVPVLRHLLQAARDAGRIVVMTSDHGHVLERGTDFRKGDSGERFRADDGQPLEDEMVIKGSRVVLPEPGRMIAPYRENLRYAVKKHGYHGGVTPQECLIPLAVLTRQVQAPKGWEELPFYRPAWWDGPLAEALEWREVRAAHHGLRPPVPERETLPLLAAMEASTRDVSQEWVAKVLASEVFASQVKLAGQRAPKPAEVAKFLAALDELGGVALKTALALKLEQPEIRMNGLIAGIRRLLNVDGYAVVAYDELSETVRLNRDHLAAQFGLE